ncbi:uncharacterized protein TNCV_1451981 [Trichonephila clavipes]|nr:uncharacterized protein TNCV_1451981 [Trichonephila clavipes]
MTGTLPPLVGLRGGWRHARTKFLRVFMDPNMLCPGKGLVLPTLTVDQIAAHSRFLLISLPNKEMSNKSPFAIPQGYISPKLPTTVKAGYLNCNIRAYIPNPLRCFSVRDCSLAQKCVNCSQPHSSDSKQCPKWKAEKEIQAIKTNRNISYLEARKLIAPQLSQTYAQVAKPSTFTSTTQTDENITH